MDNVVMRIQWWLGKCLGNISHGVKTDSAGLLEAMDFPDSAGATEFLGADGFHGIGWKLMKPVESRGTFWGLVVPHGNKCNNNTVFKRGCASHL